MSFSLGFGPDFKSEPSSHYFVVGFYFVIARNQNIVFPVESFQFPTLKFNGIVVADTFYFQTFFTIGLYNELYTFVFVTNHIYIVSVFWIRVGIIFYVIQTV